MTQHWWRAYDEAVDDPKIQLLPPPLFKAWFNILCLTSGAGGRVPPIETVAFKLRMSEAKVGAILEELVARSLLDEFDGALRPHNWDGRQFKSDVTDPTAAERMRNYRNRHRNDDRNAAVSVTVPREEQITDTDSERKDIRAVASATRPARRQAFDEFWESYPKREGANPKAPAKKVFDAAVKSGVDPAAIVAGVRNCAADPATKIGTPYVPQAVKWLRDRRWEDYANASQGPPEVVTGWKPGMPTTEELRAKYEKTNGQTNEQVGGGVRREGPSVHEGSTKNPREKCEGPDLSNHHARNGRMEQLGTIFCRSLELRATGDEAGEVGDANEHDGSDPMA